MTEWGETKELNKVADLCVIGTGTVGLVTAACFAHLGRDVVALDKDAEKVEMLRRGKIPFYEPQLEGIVQSALRSGKLHLTTSVSDGISGCEVAFICVGTPAAEEGRADLSQVKEVSRQIAEAMSSYKLLVEKSTVPVRTSYWIERTVRLYNRRGIDFEVASNPEFLREGSAVRDFLHPDRIVIGVPSERARNKLLALYEGFDCPVIVTDVNTAELIKHAANSFLAMKISFINMVSDLCDKTGADINVVSDAIGMDKRIGRAFLNAGVGYGGSCFRKDLAAFIRSAEEFGLDFSLLKEVQRINDRRIDVCIEKLRQALWVLRGKQVAILGLSFKPDTDDIRDAPAISLIRKLLEEGATLRLYDPKAMPMMQSLFAPSERVQYAVDAYDSAKGAHALVICTEWEEFGQLDWLKIHSLMLTPIVVDGRNMLEPSEMVRLGFEYHGFGRHAPSQSGI